MKEFFPITEDVSDWTLKELYDENVNIIRCKPRTGIIGIVGMIEITEEKR